MQHPAQSMLILADDLSGAADCAVGAARCGLDSVVLWSPEALDTPQTAQVVALDTNSRYLSPDQAAQVQQDSWRRHAQQQQAHSPLRPLLYKKIDSTLRGNIAAEMHALREVGVAIVAPAFISAGRTLRDGQVYVHGVPLEQTEVWTNEQRGGDANLARMLHTQGLRCAHLALHQVRGELSSHLRDLIQRQAFDAIVCDATEENDLSRIAQASIGLPVYWVGSAGLIAPLARCTGWNASQSSVPVRISGSILTVVGSVSSVSRKQASVLGQRATVQTLTLSNDLLLRAEAHPQWQATEARIGQVLNAKQDLLIQTDAEIHSELINGSALTQALGRLLQPYANAVGALVATGGETAHGLLPFLGATGLQIVREIEPGAPLSVAIGPRSFAVVTKAGAFGTPDTLIHAYQELEALRQASPPLNF